MTDKFQDKQVQNIIFNQLSKDKYYELLKEGKIVENEFYITNDSFKDNAGGLDVLDIGQSLYVDESQGLRRYLNGSWVDINRNTQLFYERLMKAASLNPELICTEDEWNALETASPFGQVGKFVVDTINGRIRLPKVVYVCGTLDLGKLGELDSQRFLVSRRVPTESAKSWYNWYSDGWLEQGNYIEHASSATGSEQQFDVTLLKPYKDRSYNIFFSSGVGGSGWQYANSAMAGAGGSAMWASWQYTNKFHMCMPNGVNNVYCFWRTEGYANKPTKADFNLAEGNGVTRYPYYIQIATGLETVLNISDQVQINNPYTLGESKYSPIQLNNSSWLHYSIRNNPRSLYPAYYDMLFRVYNGKETIDGITVKHIDDNINTENGKYPEKAVNRYDHTIDPANQTFNLPSLNGSEDTPRDLYGEKEENNQDIINCMALLKESGFLYTAPYNGWIRMDAVYEENKYFDLYNQNTRQSSIMSPASSGTVNYALLYCNAGDIVKINYTVTTVRRFEFIVATKPGHLYYYVGETNKNADLVNTGKIADIVQRHLMGDQDYYIVDSWVSGLNFWRKYSDGWMEQGGRATSGSGAFTNLNLHQPFINTNYNITVSIYNTGSNANNYSVKINAPTTTSFGVAGSVGNNAASAPAYWWHACGYWK